MTVVCFAYRAYLEFQRPHSNRGRDYSNGVIDAVYIALKKRYIIIAIVMEDSYIYLYTIRHGKNPLSITTGDYIDRTTSKFTHTTKPQPPSVIPPVSYTSDSQYRYINTMLFILA